MHQRVRREFEKICSVCHQPESVLEVGALPSQSTLLNLKVFNGVKNKVGINLNGPHTCDNFYIHKGNANNMDCFESESFDVVLCNALLEHDKCFWKTVDEIKRVTKPGGLIVLGAPGYEFYKIENLKYYLGKTPLVRMLEKNQFLNCMFTATITFQVHDAPGDYYRFSRQAFEEVLLAGLDDVDVHSVMLPPRMIGVGKKP